MYLITISLLFYIFLFTYIKKEIELLKSEGYNLIQAYANYACLRQTASIS